MGFDDWLDGLTRGVAAHHGALTPIQRELVEIAFAQELVKVVFATETLAVGVNLPARSVVIDRLARPAPTVARCYRSPSSRSSRAEPVAAAWTTSAT